MKVNRFDKYDLNYKQFVCMEKIKIKLWAKNVNLENYFPVSYFKNN